MDVLHQHLFGIVLADSNARNARIQAPGFHGYLWVIHPGQPSMKTKALLTLGLVLIISRTACGIEPANVPREDFWVPDGPVNAMALQSNILYLGGQFQSLRRNPRT